MLTYLVQISVKSEHIAEFIEATKKNVTNSLKESGITRFDLIQHADESAQFFLVEEYKTIEDVASHKETPHYKEWRDSVEKMMAQPRKGNKYNKLLP